MSGLLLVLGLIACGAPLPALSAASGYHLLRKIPLPDVSGWDYLAIDPRNRRLFLTNNSGVIVINIDTFARIGTIPHPADFSGVGLVHGVAFAARLDRGFLSHELPPSVLTFDLRTLAPIHVTPTDPGTDAIVYDPYSRRVFTMNGKHPGVHDVTAVDAVSGRRVGRIPLPGDPEFAVVDGKGHLYVNIASASELGRIDTKTLKFTAAWPMAPCEDPSGLAIDAAHRRLFAGCGNRLMAMINADTGRVVATVPSGDGTDADVFDPGTDDAFSSNGAGTLTIAHEDSPDKLTLIENLPTVPGARTMALDAKTHRVFLLTAQFGPPPPKPTRYNPHGYPVVLPGTAVLLVYGR